MNKLTRTAGFTLLEMLVAMAIFALVALMAYGGLNSIMITRDQSTQQAERLKQVQMLYRMLQRDLEQSVLRDVRDEYGDSQEALKSGAIVDYLFEVTHGGWRNPTGLARSSLQRSAYQLEDGVLSYHRWLVLDRAQDSEPQVQTLLQDVQALEIRYLDEKQEWHTEWPPLSGGSQTSLPRAAEVTLDLEDMGRITWLFQMPS